MRKRGISLYECMRCQYPINGHRLICKAGHSLPLKANTYAVMAGMPLIVTICQNCPDFDRAGDAIPKEERGWK